MIWSTSLSNVSNLVIGVFAGLLVIITVEEVSLRISAHIQQYTESDGLFGDRLDSGISMSVFGVVIFACIVISGVSIKPNSINNLDLPTIAAVIGGVSLLLGVIETIYLLKYKIPKFKSQYDSNT